MNEWDEIAESIRPAAPLGSFHQYRDYVMEFMGEPQSPQLIDNIAQSLWDWDLRPGYSPLAENWKPTHAEATYS